MFAIEKKIYINISQTESRTKNGYFQEAIWEEPSLKIVL